MDVDDVEVALSNPGPHATGGFHSETQSRDGAVVGNSYRPTPVGHPVGKHRFLFDRREDVDRVSASAQGDGQIGDMRSHSTGDIPCVGADQTDAQTHDASVRGVRSETHTFCSMCQSALCSVIPASQPRASCWVTTRTRSSWSPSVGTSTRSCT